MARFGFKEITLENWLEQDDVLKIFVMLAPDGEFQPQPSEDYLHRVLNPKLLETVPSDIQSLFEVARGAMVYGWFFAPLYTLGNDQLFRVVDAAMTYLCKELGGPKPNTSFEKRITWLVEHQVIPDSESWRWHDIRKVRNAVSHPERQSNLLPGSAIRSLEYIAEMINSLFSRT